MGILVLQMCYRILAGRYLAEYTCAFNVAGPQFRLFSYYYHMRILDADADFRPVVPAVHLKVKKRAKIAI